MNFAAPVRSDVHAAEMPLYEAHAGGLGDEIRLVLRVIVGGWRVIALAVAVALGLALAYLLATPPLYSATAELLLEPREKRIVDARVVDTGLGSSAIGADTLSLDSQIQVILSDSVARQLIEAEGLKADPEFVEAETGLGRLLGGLKRLLRGGGAPGAGSGDPDYDAALEAYRDRLDVRRKSNTYVIAIEFESEDPGKAARIANRIAEIYIASMSGAALSGTRQAAEALEGRLATLRATAAADAAAVEAYRRESGLTGTDSLAMLEGQLRDLNNQLSLARVARIEAEANLDRMRDALATSSLAGLDAALLQSPVITELQLAQTRLEAEEAQLRASYLPRHPRIADLDQRKAALEAAMGAEFRRIIERLEVQSQVAADKEASVAAQVGELEARRADLDVAALRLRELQRVAGASQAVFDEFLKRSKEVWEQVGLPSSNARVISEAFPASRASEPRASVLLLAGAVLGLGIGLFAVWLRFILRGGAAPRMRPAELRPGRGQGEPPLLVQP